MREISRTADPPPVTAQVIRRQQYAFKRAEYKSRRTALPYPQPQLKLLLSVLTQHGNSIRCNADATTAALGLWRLNAQSGPCLFNRTLDPNDATLQVDIVPLKG